MVNAMKLFFKNYVNFSGRSRRSEYWWPVLGCGIVNLIFYMIFMGGMTVALLSENQDSAVAGAMVMVSFILIIIFSLAVIVPTFAVIVRRLHDIGKSGAWFFIAFVPLVGSIVLLVFMCTDSQPGSNQWGENPKGM